MPKEELNSGRLTKTNRFVATAAIPFFENDDASVL